MSDQAPMPGAGRVPPPRFIVQYWSDWSDYPSWENYDDDNGFPIGFDTEAEAQAFIDNMLDEHFTRALTRYNEALERNRPARELYEKRKQALVDAGLWTVPDEQVSPLVFPGLSDRAPSRAEHDRWRIHPSSSDDLESTGG